MGRFIPRCGVASGEQRGPCQPGRTRLVDNRPRTNAASSLHRLHGIRVANYSEGFHAPMKEKDMQIRSYGVAVILLAASTVEAVISTAENKRVREAAAVLSEARHAGDKGIPEDLWRQAACVVVIPSLKKAAFVVGGEYGRGVMSCRTENGWSAPAFLELAKGSWGFQIGAEQIDLVLVIRNRRGAEKLLQDKVSLGADLSAAAGPIGRTATASTDIQMRAEILSYSRSQGLFAGVDISGGALKPDTDANHDVYGSATASEIVFGEAHVAVPAAARRFMQALSREPVATTGQK
jgi:lipid-binding SYLF domain-containing protein